MSLSSSENFIQSTDHAVSPINELSDNVLLEIFAFLDAKTLLSACLVCKSWENLIKSSVVTMKKFKITLNPKIVEDRNDGTYSSRKHVNLEISFGSSFDLITDFAENFDFSFVRNLNIFEGEEIRVEKLLLFLSRMPLLENLNIYENLFSHESAASAEVVKFSKLRKLTLPNANRAILEYFDAKNLIELHVIDDMPMEEDDDIEVLVKFLQNSVALKSLYVGNGMFFNIFGSKLPKFKFQLHTLQVFIDENLNSATGTNFSSFLISQSPSLKSLDASIYGETPSLIYETIISKLHNLESLSIDVSCAPDDRDFYQKLTTNKSVRRLVLQGVFEFEEAARGILKSFPNIEFLEFNEDIGRYLNYVAAYNQNLIELKLQSITNEISDGVRFSNLKKLSLVQAIQDDLWKLVVERSPVLEDLSFRFVGNELDLDIDFLLRQQSLRKLKLEGEWQEIKRLFDSLKHNYGELTTLELIMTRFENHWTTKFSVDVTFDFPQDLSEWSIEKADAKLEHAWNGRTLN